MDAVWDWHGWGWDGWEAVVGIGIFALALMTWRLARSTRRLARETAGVVRETRDLARVDKEMTQTHSSPLLVDAGGLSLGPTATVCLKNVGGGSAVVARGSGPRIRVDDADEWIEGVARSMVIPAGDVVRVEFELPWMPTERAVAELPYTDIADGPLRRTRLLITTNSDPESWEVAGFALYDGPPRSRPKLLSGPWRDEDGVAD